MKYPYYAPETNKEYDCENEYDFKIKSFIEKNDHNFWDDEVIEYAIKIKTEIVSSLEKDSSNSDKIKVDHIEWIEKYLDNMHDYMIQQKMQISILIKKHKNFAYTTNAKLIGRPLGKRNTQSRRKWLWIRDQYYKLKDKKVAHTNEEYARLIRSQLFKDKPDFWGENIYTLEIMKDIIRKQKWGD